MKTCVYKPYCVICGGDFGPDGCSLTPACREWTESLRRATQRLRAKTRLVAVDQNEQPIADLLTDFLRALDELEPPTERSN